MANIVPTTTTTMSNYVPFGGRHVTLGEEAVMPASDYPTLQFATGLKAQRSQRDADGYEVIDEETGEVMMDNVLYTGFFTECDKHADLDAVLRAKGASTVLIAHGGGEVVKHWALQKIAVFLVAKGLPNNAHDDGQRGMVYTWRPKRTGVGQESVVYVQVMIRQLMPEYCRPFVLTLKSTQSTDLLQAMAHQYKVIRRAHEELQRIHQDIALPLWSYSLPLGPAKNKVMRGPKGKQSAIFPVVALVPQEITGEYLHRHEVPMDYVDVLREASEKSVDWATSLHQRISSGTEPQEPWQQGTTPVVTEDAPF